MFDPNSGKKPGENTDFQRKIVFFVILIVFTFFILILRLGNIQIIKNISYKKQASTHRERIYKVVPSRGQILSEDGKLLATNKTSFNINVIQNEFYREPLSRQNELILVCEILNLNYYDTENFLKEQSKTSEVVLKENITFSEFNRIKENSDNLPGIIIREILHRDYPHKDLLAHVLGYTGPISTTELMIKNKQGYQRDDYIGKDGIEMYYEEYLRGKPGEKVYQIDARMIIQDELFDKEKKPVPGYELILTINYELQKTVEDILADRLGSIIVLKPNTGEVLAMASYPDFDPNIYILNSAENNKKKIELLLNTKFSPLINRAIKSKYPPASIFKIVTATAIVKENLLPETQKYYCGGIYRLNNESFKCWVHPGGHAWQNLTDAIANSCDVFFYNAGLVVGPERIKKYANLYGFGNKLNIDLPSEEIGLIPSPDWMKNRGSLWLPGYTLITTIGQGDVLVTSLQIANLFSVISNKGYSYRPHVLKEIRSPNDDSIVEEIKRDKIIDMGESVDEATFDFIHNALREVVTNGTAGRAFYSSTHKIAGKTGTAEVGMEKDKKQTHSWFAGFGPVDYEKEDRIVVVVMIEYENSNTFKYAAPLANMVFNSWLNKENYEQSARRLGYPIKKTYN